MKKNLILLTIVISVVLTGCFAPVNLSYDSAKTLDKGQIQVKGNYSKYFVTSEQKNDTTYKGEINQNYGVALAYGVSDKYTVGVRYEYLKPTLTFQKIFNGISSDFNAMNSLSFFEIDNKLSLARNNVAVSLPIGAYFYNSQNLSSAKGGLGWLSLDPKMYFTFFRSSKVFELSVIPKLHILFGTFGGYVLPGISMGMGFSSDLDKWAIRPEIGYDRYFSFGVGAGINFNTHKGSDK